MSNKEACKLLIENIDMFDEICELFDELDGNFFKAIDEVIKNKVESFNDSNWQGEFDLKNEGIKFSPESWVLPSCTNSEKVNDKKYSHKKYYAQYSLGYSSAQSDKEGTQYWMTTFFPNNKDDRVVFVFSSIYANYQKCNKTDWKKFAQEQENRMREEIGSFGFEFNSKEGVWYLPVESFDKREIAEHYVNDTLNEEALRKILEALDKLKDAHQYFDKIVQEAIQRFGSAEDE